MTVRILKGDCRGILRSLPADSVHCCVTSPPYFGLRDYGTGEWVGGDNPECQHKVREQQSLGSSTLDGGKGTVSHAAEGFRNQCPRCGAVRVDRQIGLEPSPDEFVAELVAVFAEVRRVLRKDGTAWLNLGDSYARDAGKGQHKPGDAGKQNYIIERGNGRAASTVALRKFRPGSGRADGVVDPRGQRNRDGVGPVPGLKEKDLIGVPWRVAFALQADGWYLRQDQQNPTNTFSCSQSRPATTTTLPPSLSRALQTTPAAHTGRLGLTP